jgi:hypothetical protein
LGISRRVWGCIQPVQFVSGGHTSNKLESSDSFGGNLFLFWKHILRKTWGSLGLHCWYVYTLQMVNNLHFGTKNLKEHSSPIWVWSWYCWKALPD